MKLYTIGLMLLFTACPEEQVDLIADEVAQGIQEEIEEEISNARCHIPVTQEETEDRIIFTTCDGNQTYFLKPKNGRDGVDGTNGRSGSNGRTGPAGPIGPAGESGTGSEQFVTVCEHGQDHIDRTSTQKVSDLISGRWGSKSQHDYSGNCHNEDGCNCDQCSGRPQPNTLDSRFYFYHDDLMIRRGR